MADCAMDIKGTNPEYISSKKLLKRLDLAAKRGIDILASGLGLVALSPLFAGVALWIKWDSRGPVFYRQRRVGQGEKEFELFKFRSMISNSDRESLLTIGGHDPRVTKAGYYIRKFKIDELPQLINVLRGDMSLVGPRPQVRKYVDLYTEEQLKVLEAKPGITDPASIYYRHESEILSEQKNPEEYYINVIMPHKLGLCRNYIEKRNVLTDMKVIIDTFRAVANHKKEDSQSDKK